MLGSGRGVRTGRALPGAGPFFKAMSDQGWSINRHCRDHGSEGLRRSRPATAEKDSAAQRRTTCWAQRTKRTENGTQTVFTPDTLFRDKFSLAGFYGALCLNRKAIRAYRRPLAEGQFLRRVSLAPAGNALTALPWRCQFRRKGERNARKRVTVGTRSLEHRASALTCHLLNLAEIRKEMCGSGQPLEFAQRAEAGREVCRK